MHVLFVDHTGHVSGAEHSLQSLIAGLRAEGARCSFACPPGANQDLARGIGLEPLTIGAAEGSLRLHPVRTSRSIAEIGYAATQVARIARRLDVDVVHANSIRASLVSGLAGRIAQRATVAHLRDRLPPGVATRASLRLIAASCARIVANSRFTAAALQEARIEATATVVVNPVDLELFRPLAEPERAAARARLNLHRDALALGVVGQITPWKGQATALRALAELAEHHPRLQLLVVGEAKFLSASTRYDNGAYLRVLHELARDERLAGRVDFLGERDDVPAIMGALDVLLVPSHGEPFGRVVVEAMAAGTPVVASTVGGPSEIIENNVSGLLVDADDVGAWTAAIERLATDEPLRRSLATHGHARSADFSIPAHVDAVLGVYRSVLDDPTRRPVRSAVR
jgi:glycosyltransferase involved in cell wall biosynthesis